MPDAFAALWDSSAPTKSNNAPPQKLGSAASQAPMAARKPTQDVFSLLAASSAPNSRPITPSSVDPKVSKKPPVAVASGDAFSGLLDSTLGGSSKNLTIAERAARAEQEQRERMQKHQQSVHKQSLAWDGLDLLANPSSVNPSKATRDDWDFGMVEPPKPASKAVLVKTSPPEDDWGLSEFSSQPPAASSSASATPPPQTILDLDDFSLLEVQDSRPPQSLRTAPSFGSQGDFDSIDLRDGLLGDESQGEDDILGVLSKPVDAIPKRVFLDNSSDRATPSPLPSMPSSRPVSPPPHILGQIVEMGFSVEQARVALASTSTGLDVQAALETLLSNGAGSDPSPHGRQPRDRDEGLDSRRRPSRQSPIPGAAPAHERLSRETPSPSGSQQERNNQAEKLLSQASEIGLSVFNRANAFWNQSKEKVQKVYEERAKGVAGSESSRPRWMQESSARGNAAEDSWENGDGAFSDEVSQPKPTNPVGRKIEPQQKPRSQPKAPDLFSDEPAIYVSPYRRGRPAQPPPTEAPIPSVSSSSRPPSRAPTPIKLIQRHTVSASHSVISSSAQHKSTGTEKFKLGQYAAAETAYTAAISILPASHLLLVPLYNNRALTRMKTGDCTGAVEDCSAVITLIGPGYHPKSEAKVTSEEEGASVDLGDALAKAWRRRAEANEGREKWALAQTDWESLAAADWLGQNLRGEAVRGAGRCRRMATSSGDPTSTAKTPSKPPVRKTVTRPAIRRGPTPPSEALSKLREANNAADAEEQVRYELKDSVDARLVGWKGGKETNIRALIASLDLVLWPELGWQKVGMADLVTPSQVKIRYTKAIAKLHPDKLRAGNTTVEQRMIANGVFGALNEAWNAFKQ